MPSRANAAPAFLYVPGLGDVGSATVLSEAECHYVSRVCRAREGELVRGTDGCGRIASLRLTAVGAAASATVESIESVARARQVWMLCGEPEGNRDDWMVEKLAELGVARWTPLDTTRATWGDDARRRERWQRLAIAALKQSCSAWLMRLDEPSPLDTALAEVPAVATRWLASEQASRPSAGQGGAEVVAVVGPAPGLAPEEVEWLLSRQFTAVSLAHTRLRAETAAISIAAWWSAAP